MELPTFTDEDIQQFTKRLVLAKSAYAKRNLACYSMSCEYCELYKLAGQFTSTIDMSACKQALIYVLSIYAPEVIMEELL